MVLLFIQSSFFPLYNPAISIYLCALVFQSLEDKLIIHKTVRIGGVEIQNEQEMFNMHVELMEHKASRCQLNL